MKKGLIKTRIKTHCIQKDDLIKKLLFTEDYSEKQQVKEKIIEKDIIISTLEWTLKL